MSGRFLRIEELVPSVGKGKSTIWAQIRQGKFPKPVRHGKRCTRWVESEIEAWKAKLIAERDGHA